MAYVLFALRVPSGADLEETAEALAVRVGAGIERGDPSGSAEETRHELVRRATSAEPSLSAATAEIAVTSALTDGAGVRVDVHEDFVRVRLGYLADAEVATAVMGRVFRVLGAVATEDGWCVYDPQGVTAVTLDEAGRAATLELYQSVVDQVAPTPFVVVPRSRDEPSS